MFDQTTTQILMIAGGLSAATLVLLVVTALVLAALQRRRWDCRDRWAAFEREARREVSGPNMAWREAFSDSYRRAA